MDRTIPSAHRRMCAELVKGGIAAQQNGVVAQQNG